MSLLDTNSDELIAAAEQAPAPIQRKEPAKRFSTWSMLGAAPKGVAAGVAEATGSTADILGAFGQALATTGGSGKGMFATPTPEERKQTNEATDKLLKEGIDYNSEAGRAFRNVSADYTPDPQTAHVAESAVFNLFRVGSKALTSAATMGNIPGAVVAGLEEGFTQSDQLGQQGVDLATRSKVGAVTALTNALGFALPVAGATWKSTAALAVAGGPASFIAQNAATREILQAADYSKLADQYDPLDPVGLALSTLLPLGFGALAMRGAKVKPGVEAKGPMPDGTPPPDTAPPKMAPPDDLVDAARVNLVREHMDATNPAPGNLVQADAHTQAYTRAMDQQAAGERVSVADIAPKVEQNLLEWGARETAKNGEFVKADYKLTDSQPIYQMREMSPADLYLPELDSSGKLQPEKRGYLPGYIERAKAGEIPPAITAIEMEDGRIRVVDGHRRAMAAKEAGNTIRVLVSPLIDTPAGKVEATAENIANNPIADWGAGLTKALDDMAAERAKLQPKPAPDLAAFMAANGLDAPAPAVEQAAVKGNAFISWLKDAGGVAWSQKTDIVGERGVRGNYAGIFTKKGQNLDTLVESAVQAGYLTRADLEASGDVGGTRALSELIRRATTGEKIATVENADAARIAQGQARAAMDAVDAMERELKALGVDTSAARGNADALGAYLAEHRTELVNKKLADIDAETRAERIETGEAYNLNPKQIDAQARIALAGELDENAMHQAAMVARDEVDFLNRIEEIINNAPGSRKTIEGGPGSAADASVPARDGQAATDPAASTSGSNQTDTTGSNAGAVDSAAAVSPVAARLDDISYRNPSALDAEIAVAFDEKGKPTSTMTVREYLDMVKQEAASDIKDASLFEVAANCFLSGGA